MIEIQILQDPLHLHNSTPDFCDDYYNDMFSNSIRIHSIIEHVLEKTIKKDN